MEENPTTMSPSRTSTNQPHLANASLASSSTNLNLRAFGFENKSSYDATRELTRLRDSNFHLRPPSKDNDIWKRPPPDFRPQCFEPKPPKRNSREAMKPWRYNKENDEESKRDEDSEKEVLALPELMKPKAVEEKDFVLKFHVMDPDEARADFVTNGMFPAGQFKNPGHHDHRQYPSLKSLGLSEFQTSFEADPFGNRFKSERLGIIHGLSRGIPPERNITGPQMNPPYKQPPKWESRLHLPAGVWPTPVAQYSRFRPFWRSPQTVLLDRMEHTLSTKWQDEKLESMEKAQQRIRERNSKSIQIMD